MGDPPPVKVRTASGAQERCPRQATTVSLPRDRPPRPPPRTIAHRGPPVAHRPGPGWHPPCFWPPPAA